jgi:hypothetical protein
VCVCVCVCVCVYVCVCVCVFVMRTVRSRTSIKVKSAPPTRFMPWQ